MLWNYYVLILEIKFTFFQILEISRRLYIYRSLISFEKWSTLVRSSWLKKWLFAVSREEICFLSSSINSNSNMSMFCSICSFLTDLARLTTPRSKLFEQDIFHIFSNFYKHTIYEKSITTFRKRSHLLLEHFLFFWHLLNLFRVDRKGLFLFDLPGKHISKRNKIS